ncbi:MAG: hypothetical protein OXC10_00325 [Rhodospirillaceae bacterium]|nr:hypothetical protein [Rhodospirillaceae bacterium]
MLAISIATLPGCGSGTGAIDRRSGIPPAGEHFHGQRILMQKVRAVGPLEGKLTIMDTDCQNPVSHCQGVAASAVRFGIPRANISFAEKGRWGDPDYESVTPHFEEIEMLVEGLADSENPDRDFEELERLEGRYERAPRIFLTQETWKAHREQSRVVILPYRPVFHRPGDGSLIARHNVLFVASIGNVEIFRDQALDTDSFVRNWYEPGWCGAPGSAQRLANGRCDDFSDENLAKIFQNLKDAQGKALYATWGDVRNGKVVPYPYAIRCGEAKNDCFTVILPREYRGRKILSTDDAERYVQGTSFASPALGSYLFYLAQLWGDGAEVRSVLNECAIDVGEPGIDREFGRGVPSADCRRVAMKERSIARASVSVGTKSPVMEARGVTVSPSSAEGISASYAGKSRATRERAMGRAAFGEAGRRAGVTAPVRLSLAPAARPPITPDLYLGENLVAAGATRNFATGESLSLAIGQGKNPLAVTSSLAAPASRTSFIEVGIRLPLFTARNALVFLSGSYGRGDDELRASVARAGLSAQYWRNNHLVVFDLRYAQASGSVGIPGHDDVGRKKVPFTKDAAAAHVSYRMAF